MIDTLVLRSVAKDPAWPNEDCAHISDRYLTLCDGATESYNSRLWAQILAEQTATDGPLTQEWYHSCIARYERECRRENLSWAQELAYSKGSYATLLSFHYVSGEHRVDIVSVGDSSCIIWAEGQEPLPGTPCRMPEDFNNYPELIDTNGNFASKLARPETLAHFQHSVKLDPRKKYSFLLMTDALANWTLTQPDRKTALERLINASWNEEEFREFVEQERAAGTLKLDDTTMIHITVSKYGAPYSPGL